MPPQVAQVPMAIVAAAPGASRATHSAAVTVRIAPSGPHGISRTYGAGIRRLRRMSMRADNREPIWDRTGEVPTAFASERRKPTTTSKVAGFFYKRLQYSGTVNHAKRWKDQPLPRSMDILHKEDRGDTPEARNDSDRGPE